MLDLLRRGDTEVFKRLVESVRDYAIFLLAPDGTIVSWNTGAEHIKGYTAEQIIGKHFSIFYTPDALERGWPAEELRRSEAAGHFEDEGWRVRRDGSKFWANVIISPVRGAAGELLGFSKVTRDLTERRKHEQALKEREENLRLLVEGVKDHAMFVLDADGRVKTWNFGADRLFGYTGDQVIGKPYSSQIPAQEALAGRAQALLAAAQAGGFVHGEAVHQRSDGSLFWSETTATPLTDDAGRLVGYGLIVRDATEKMRVKALESEGRRLSDFIAVLSHELRNPMAPIANAMTILKRQTQQADALWCIDLVTRQIEHMRRLVEDLMDVSRVTTGKIRLELSTLDLVELTRLALASVDHLVHEHGHMLDVQLPAQPVRVTGDSTRLTQVLVNLVSNACKYTPNGGQLRVSLTQAGGLATLQVADSGIGMSSDILQTAFDPFVQGDRGLDRSEGGLGVGLTLVRHIVELHRGVVSAASPGVNKGTTVTVKLPLAAVGDEDAGTADAAGDTVIPALPRKVLVVDDNLDAAETLALLLRSWGHEVRTANDGPEALALAAADRPDVVLMDIGLPGMSGTEAGRRLRDLPGLDGVQIIAVTGYGQGTDRDATAQAGFDLHVTKPVNPEELNRLIVAAATQRVSNTA